MRYRIAAAFATLALLSYCLLVSAKPDLAGAPATGAARLTPSPSGANAPVVRAAAATAQSAQAFAQAFPVFLHPRCMNCHPTGDVPLQGDDSRPHQQRVRRGRDGLGIYSMKCSNCHQTENIPGPHMPPGAPNWHLTPANMKMVFQGRTAGELCRQLKDPKQNGGKTVEQIVEHSASDKLVLWGWEPGEGRTPVSMPHAEFARLMQEWGRNGAACPSP
ncbi:MAG: hypothetical protein ACRD5W_14855 [Candidatus Acidiferrales bacterium]